MTDLAALDEQSRLAAIDPAQSFVVQAPAGSGKTSLLTHRFLRLLACVEQPEEIVAITFTRKAAAEMRHRVVAALAGAVAGLPANAGEHERATHELATAALDNSRRRGWELERHSSRLHIQTIDGLNHWLAARLPLTARLGLSPQLLDDARPLYSEAARPGCRSCWNSPRCPTCARRWKGCSRRPAGRTSSACMPASTRR